MLTFIIPVHSLCRYDTMTIASCIAPLDAAEVRELIFATRIPTASNATLVRLGRCGLAYSVGHLFFFVLDIVCGLLIQIVADTVVFFTS